MFFQIETTTICNAACAFCVHKTTKREQTHMQQFIFEKTIEDINRVYPLYGITLTGLGETLLDPDILYRIKYIRALFGNNVPVSIFTNGTNLEKYLDELIGLDVDITLSVNGINSEKRKSTMGIDPLNGTDIQDILKKYNKIKVSVVVDWGMVEHGDREIFQQQYGDKLFMHFAGNWAGKLFNIKFKPVKSCCRPFQVLHILVDGRVALCCFDSDGEVILGNNVLEALQGSELRNVQTMMEAGKRYELPLCKNCTTI